MIVRGLIAFELPDAPACTQKNTRSHDSPRLDVTLPVPAVWQANRHVNHCAGVGYRKQVIQIAGVIKILTTGFINVGRHPASAIPVDPDVCAQEDQLSLGFYRQSFHPMLGNLPSTTTDTAIIAINKLFEAQFFNLSCVLLQVFQGLRPLAFDICLLLG
jgi:hypothetical protein